MKFIGYGGGRSFPVDHALYAAAGHAVLVMDTRGQGGGGCPARPATGRRPLGRRAPGRDDAGHRLARDVLLPAALHRRRARASRPQPSTPWSTPRIAVHGFSQGGGLSLAAAALAPGLVRLCMADMPYLCDIERRRASAGHGLNARDPCSKPSASRSSSWLRSEPACTSTGMGRSRSRRAITSSPTPGRSSGIPNALDVLSNVPFFLVGCSGLAFLRRGPTRDPDGPFRPGAHTAFESLRERPAYVLFFAGVLLTAFGSGWYHLKPIDPAALLGSPPMAIAFTALFAAMIAERISIYWSRMLLLPFVFAGVASVVMWRLSEEQRRGRSSRSTSSFSSSRCSRCR